MPAPIKFATRGLWKGWVTAVASSAAILAGDICLGKSPDYKTPVGKIDPAMVEENSNGTTEFYYGSHALLIGESHFRSESGLSELGNIVPELKNLGAVLERQGFEVTTYFDLDTKELQPTIENFIREYGYGHPNSRMLIYFSGHGITREVEVPLGEGLVPYKEIKGYVLPVDTNNPRADKSFVRQALPLSQFVEWAKAIEVKHALFIFDSCFSGAILNTRSGGESLDALKKARLKPPVTVTSDEAQLPLRYFITAGTDKQEVPAQSKFLQVIIEALSGRRPEADVNADGYLTSGELYQYLRGVVPQESVRQTPTQGWASGEFSRGELVFRLPGREAVISAPAADPVPETGGVNLRSVFIGGSKDGQQTIAQAYQADTTLNVGAVGCFRNCRDEPARKYTLTLTMPRKMPETAIFTNPILTCSGNCFDYMKVLKQPTASADNRTVSADIEAGGQPSTWRLTADVKMPTPGGQAVVLDVSKNLVANMELLSTLKTIAKSSVSIDARRPSLDTRLKAALDAAQSDNTMARRNGRDELTRLIEEGGENFAAQLIRGMPAGNYRYKLAVAEALSKVARGWRTRESISLDILANEKKLRDSTLSRSIDAALANLISFVYYEVGDNGWLTRNGQLRPVALTRPPLPAAAEVRDGDVLLAASAVNMRIGPSSDSGVSNTLEEGKCVVVVSGTDQTMQAPISGAAIKGIWLRVKPSHCR